MVLALSLLLTDDTFKLILDGFDLLFHRLRDIACHLFLQPLVSQGLDLQGPLLLWSQVPDVDRTEGLFSASSF